MMTTRGNRRSARAQVSERGFSLLELLVALGVFLLISGVSFALFARHQALLSQEQSSVGLNIGLRSALAQLQLDVVNAGDGLILGTNVPAWPVGVTIQNTNPTSATCNPTTTSPPTYAAACFDSMSVILVDANTPGINPCVVTSCTISTSGSSTITGVFPTGYAATTYAGNFKRGDQILFIQSCTGGSSSGLASGSAANSSGCKYTTATLTAAGSTTTTGTGCSSGCVVLNFTSTNTGGTNTPLSTGSNVSANDMLGLTVVAPTGQLTDQFGQNDWVVRLAPITYSVDTTTSPSDPRLMRTQAGGTPNILMDQVVGFKVGAALWNNSNTSSFQYNYQASSYSPTPYQYNLIRSIRVTLIGRTAWDATNPYVNPFDLGHYQIRGNSIIVNPRNLTMNSD